MTNEQRGGGEPDQSKYSGANIASELQQAKGLDRSTQRQERPLEVMREGHDRMLQWGLSADRIGQLEEMTSSYEYANLVGRAERVVLNGGVLLNDEAGDWVVLPNFFDYAGDRRDGQCGEIAAKLLVELHKSGWLEETNTTLKAGGRTSLMPWYCTGTSMTHFNRPGLRHTWTALALEDQDPAAAGLILDASFRRIDAFEKSEYKATHKQLDPQFFTTPTATRCRLTKIESGESGRTEITVLGLSQNGFYSVGLGFVQPPDDDRIVTVLGATAPNGVQVGCHLSAQGEMVWDSGEIPVAAQYREELEQTLRSLSSFEIVRDQDMALRLLAERQRLDVSQ